MRDQCSRLTINWIGGGRMRSLNMFLHRDGCTEHKGGFHQTHRCRCACALADTLVQKTFFGQLLYTSAVAMVTQVCDPAEARDWLERCEGEEGRGTLLEGYRGVRGRGPDTKTIRSMHNNPYKCHFI